MPEVKANTKRKLVSELSGTELDYWVGVAEGINLKFIFNAWHYKKDGCIGWDEWSPRKRPEQAYPIIERDKIGFRFHEKPGCWFASIAGYPATCCEGETALIAAMCCKVASVYGETVECVI